MLTVRIENRTFNAQHNPNYAFFHLIGAKALYMAIERIYLEFVDSEGNLVQIDPNVLAFWPGP